MPEESKENLNKFIMLFLAAMMSIALQGMVNRSNRIDNSASKTDVENVKNEAILYTDKAFEESKVYTNDQIAAQEKTFQATLNGIDGKLNIIISTQNAILKKEMGNN